MRKVILDTDVLVEAILKPKSASAIILNQLMNGEVTHCHDSEIIAAYENELTQSHFKFDPKSLEDLLHFIRETGHSVVPKSIDVETVSEQAKTFYAVAKHTGGYLVTKCPELYPADQFVVSAEQFLEL